VLVVLVSVVLFQNIGLKERIARFEALFRR
jgi:hypothetical protein